MKISSVWHTIGLDQAACLVVEGGDPLNIQHRYAFIEKTARIRVRPGSGSTGHDIATLDFQNWAPGPHRSGWRDEEARAWCVNVLRLFGHEVGEAEQPIHVAGENGAPKPVWGVYLDKVSRHTGVRTRKLIVELAERLLPGIVSVQHTRSARGADSAAVATALRTAVEFLVQTGQVPADIHRPYQEPSL